MKSKFTSLCGLAASGALLLAGAAKANTIQAIETSAGPLGPDFVYTYSVQLTPNNGLSGAADANQSGMVILDFPGAISASVVTLGTDVTSAANWGVGVAPGGGVTGSGQTWAATSWANAPFPGQFTVTGFIGGATFSDDGSTPNIVLLYNGPTMPIVNTQTDLIHLVVTSTLPLDNVLQSVSRDSALGGVPNEIDTYPVAASIGGGAGGPPPVPTPAASWTGASLLAGLGIIGFMRKRRQPSH